MKYPIYLEWSSLNFRMEFMADLPIFKANMTMPKNLMIFICRLNEKIHELYSKKSGLSIDKIMTCAINLLMKLSINELLLSEVRFHKFNRTVLIKTKNLQ